MKPGDAGPAGARDGRTPQGVRGLKPDWGNGGNCGRVSHSARSAWIETGGHEVAMRGGRVALRKECVD